MKNYLLLFFLIVTLFSTNAQDLGWAHIFGATGSDQGLSLQQDLNGNIYSCGIFQDTIDADPGPGINNLYSHGNFDVFIQKLDSNGNFLWAKSFGGIDWDNAYSIYTDESGHLFITGDFKSTVDFDPGAGVFNLTSNGMDDIFVMQLDTAGNFGWAIAMGDTSYDYGTGIIVGSSGNVYVTGNFNDTIDTDPGPGVNNLTGSGCFVIKYSTSGAIIWANSFPAITIGKNITLDSSENIFLMGGFFGTNDFDPGIGVNNLTAVTSFGDICIQKIDSSGNYLWAKSIAADQSMGNYGITIDSSQNILLCGDFNMTGDFDPGAGVYTMTPSAGSYDIFICKLNPAGNFLWAKSIGGPNTDLAMAVSCDKLGSCYITGLFNNTVDFDPNAGVYSLTAGTNNFCFLEKLDANGNFIWAGALGNGQGKSIETDENFNVYTTGWIGYTADFDFSANNYVLTSAGGTDAFVFKLSQDICSNMAVITDSISHLSCQDSGYISLHAITGFTPYAYSWNTIPPVSDSAISITMSGIYSVTVTDTVGCQRSLAYLINGPAGINFFDLQANLAAGNFRPGFTTTIFADGSNLACVPVSGVYSLVMDSLTYYSSAVPLTDSVSGDTLFWSFSSLTFDSAHITPHIILLTDTLAQIGDTVCFDVFINPISGDADSSNNYKTYCFPVVNGYDPNDIAVYPQGVCPEHYVLNDQKITYTIRFQNTGNSNAINISVLDSLDSNLDLNSVRVIANSHPLITEVLPGNVLKFRFDNIMLPDSGANEPASHGYVIYEADPLPSLPTGTQIKNQADIYFDFNPLVITNEVMNTIIDSIPACSITTSINNSSIKNSLIKIYPNPAKDVLFIEGVQAGSTIKIFDLSGRLQSEHKTVSGKNMISAENLTSGIYLLEIRGKNTKEFSKIIISR